VTHNVGLAIKMIGGYQKCEKVDKNMCTVTENIGLAVKLFEGYQKCEKVTKNV
jgi:hypothetical protein